MTSQPLDLAIHSVRVTPKTCWTFIELTDRDGHTGVGEATLFGHEDAVISALNNLNIALDDEPSEAILDALPTDNIDTATAASAVMQALWDLHARRRNVTLSDALGGLSRKSINVYANINRVTTDRSPEGFASTARDAVDAGHTAFKLAPFDEITPEMSLADMKASIGPGVARVAAARDTVGPDRELMVDCHWRFRADACRTLIDALADQNLYWLECPIVESDDTRADIVAIRGYANERGMRLTGLEKTIRVEGFRPWLEAGAYDVMMPDIKHAGGPCELLRIATLFDRYGVQFTPHNPTGPVAHVASIAVCSALDVSGRLEMQFNETPRFDEMISPSAPSVQNGSLHGNSDDAGLGVTLNRPLLTQLARDPQT